MNYSSLAGIYEKLEKTSKRLEKILILSEFLKKIKEDELEQVILLLQGKVFPEWDERKLGIAEKIVIKAINIATGISTENIEKEWKKTGDLGLTTENMIINKKQHSLFSQYITVKKVVSNLEKLAGLSGSGALDNKVQLIAELLTSATPKEAKYIVRTLLEDLRVGLGEGTIRDAIVWAFFGKELNITYDKNENELLISNDDREKYNSYILKVQEVIDISNDFSKVISKAKKGLKELEKLNIEIGKPVKVMLAQKVQNLKEGFERVGKPADLEYKYDGFRMQIHNKDGKITIFTRRLENVTLQFPEVIEIIKKNVQSNNFIIDCEAVGYDVKTKKYLPFQNISQRIKRKYKIDDMAKKYPVELNIFDILVNEGKTLIKVPFKKRREIIEKIVKPENLKIRLAENMITSDEKDGEKFYKKSLEAGNEGIILKKLDGIYKPGSRVGFMVKLKPVMETLDLVVVGAEWGTGKRSGWLTSFTLACRKDDEFIEIGKVGTGFKELEHEGGGGFTFQQMTDLLKPLIIKEKGREVDIKPGLVIEVKYEEIQKSPSYSSGYALRFPRLVRIREDRSPNECSSISEVIDLFNKQKK
ncbi:MAG: ATP-dependent DNA ligase [Candidatus Woesearchaeota archaeon]